MVVDLTWTTVSGRRASHGFAEDPGVRDSARLLR